MSERRNDVWTKVPPVKDGWYWWRENISHIALIALVDSGLKARSLFLSMGAPVDTIGGEWYGPLQEPGGDVVENCQ